MSVDVEGFHARLADYQRRQVEIQAAGRQYDPERAARIKGGMMDRQVRIGLTAPSTVPLRRERLRQRLTMRELAAKASVSYNTIYSAENQRVKTRPETFAKLATALGVDEIS